MIAEMKEKLHFQVTFSPKSTSCLLKLSICSDVWLTCPPTRHLVSYETNRAKTIYIISFLRL